MRTTLISVAAGLALAVLAGCGTTPQAAPERAAFAVDHDLVAAVERVAHKRGVRVIWVNMPSRALY